MGTSKGCVSIDGDKFLLDMPTVPLWTNSFVTMAAEIFQNYGETTSDIKTILAPEKNEQGFLFWGHTNHTDKTVGVYLIAEKEEKADQKSGWRPVLIPIDPIDDPNGTIFTGGTLYIDGEPAQKKDFRRPPFPYPQPSPDITIGNTVPGYELDWFVWKGWLVCTDVLVSHLTHTQLVALGYGHYPQSFPKNCPQIKEFLERESLSWMRQQEKENERIVV